MTKIDEATRKRLAGLPVSALSTVLTRLGIRHACMRDVRPANPLGARMAGQAFTLRYIPAREDLDSLASFSRDDALQRVALEQCPPGFVLVIDARGDDRTACAGDMFVTRLMQRGCAGIVTDGGLRDVEPISRLPFPAFLKSPAAPPTFIGHHPVEIDVPIGCGGVAVYPGDVLVGDADGVIVIPIELLTDVIEGASEIVAYDEFVDERLAAGASLIGLYPATEQSKADYARWKAERDT